MSVEGMYIFNALDLILSNRRTAYAPTNRNSHARQLALKRSEYQRIPFQKVKPRPVHIRQTFKQQRAGISQSR
ncbi:hypothetical protein D3C80_2012170 [compost metagenome]